jgi:hypothetical protein
MLKPSTIAAFFSSMLVTAFFVTTSYLGIYLYTALHREIRRAGPVPTRVRVGKHTPAAHEKKLTEVA